MDGIAERRPVAALFAFLVSALVWCAAFAQVAPPTCQKGQYVDQFNVCVDACQHPYAPGTEILSGEQRPARLCLGGDGGVSVVVSGGGSSSASARPYCWHYLGSLKEEGFNSDGRRYEDYSLYTNPRDTCANPGGLECGKLGCDIVEGGSNPLAAGISASGKPAPVIAGVLGEKVSTINNGPGQYVQPGGTAVATGSADEFCAIYGYNYNGSLCQFDSATYSMKGVAGAVLQQADNDDLAYTPNTSDVNCVIEKTTINGNTWWYAKSGSCNGTFWATFEPAAQVSVCGNNKGHDYAGPNPQGYNPATSSPPTVCLLSNVSPYWKPKVGAAATGTGSQPYSTAPNFYACEYALSRSAGVNAYSPSVQIPTAFVYRATGNACGTVGVGSGSGGTTAGNGANGQIIYKPGSNDLYCDNGKIQIGYDFPGTPAKCTGDYVGANGVESANHYFGGRGGSYVKINNGQLSVVSTGDGTTPENGNYSVNDAILGGDASQGTNEAGSGTPGSSGSGMDQFSGPASMPSATFDPWYTAKYPDGPKGVWQARITAVKASRLGTWVEGFKVVTGAAYVPRLQFDFLQYHVNWTMPPEIMSALRMLALVSAVLAARKIIFGG